MKIIHTSDWHIGQLFNFHYDRQEEHQFFLRQLKEFIAEKKPDALLVSGDVYDKSTPGNASMRFFFDNLLEIIEIRPEMTVVITAGNHDSSSRLETDRGIWKLHNAHFIGAVERNDEKYLFDKHIIKIDGKGYVVAIPYMSGCYNDFYNAILTEVESRNTENLPVVMMGHTTIGNAIFDSHETVNFNGLISVGGINSLDLSEIDDKYDYFALGHIHTPQTLSNGKARYCGSPVQINFKEGFAHSVSLVEVSEHGKLPIIKELELKPLKKFYTIPSKPQSLDDALATLELNLPEEPGYVQLNILADGPLLADTENRIRKVLSKNENLLYCDYKVSKSENSRVKIDEKPDFSLSEFKEKDPFDIAQRYYQSKFNSPLDDSLAELLRSVIEEVRDEYTK